MLINVIISALIRAITNYRLYLPGEGHSIFEIFNSHLYSDVKKSNIKSEESFLSPNADSIHEFHDVATKDHLSAFMMDNFVMVNNDQYQCQVIYNCNFALRIMMKKILICAFYLV